MKKYIVLDLEWNQNPDTHERSADKLTFEIIEIGAAKLDANFNIIDTFHRVIKPVVYQNIHYKVYEIIHIGMEELRKRGELFPLVCKDFIDWCFEFNEGDSTVSPVFCTWGDMDLNELQKNMSYHKIEFGFSYPLLYYDIQKLFSLLYCKSTKDRLPLDKAVAELRIQKNKPFHSALNDALYTAEILKRIDFHSVKEYLSLDYFKLPKNKEEELYLVFPDYSKYVSRVFEHKENALEDKTVTDMICHKCNRMLKKKIRWFPVNQKNYYCLASCPEHGFVKGKIRVKSGSLSGVFIVKTMKVISLKDAEAIRKKKEDTRLRRNKQKNNK